MTHSPSLELEHPPTPALTLAHGLTPLTALWAAAVLVLVYSAVHLASAWSSGSNLGQSSGIVIGQAIDLAEGVFYRPIVSERGFGGTRYMPLPFVILAPFIRMGLDPVNVAYTATLLTDLGLLAGVYVLLRRLGVTRALAAPVAGLALAAASAQYAATTVRGDLLPATLNVWGLAFALTAGKDLPRPRPALAALFFTLAFTGKIVALSGVSAAVLAMLLRGHWKNALKLTLFTWLGMALVLGIIHLASEGRFVENLRVCAAGGTSWDWAEKFWKRSLFNKGFEMDWPATATFAMALLALFPIRWNRPGQVAMLAVLLAIVVVLAEYVSLVLAAGCFLATPALFRMRCNRLWQWALLMIVVEIVIGLWWFVSLYAAAVFIALSPVALLCVDWEQVGQTPPLALLLTALVTVGLFTSPGIGFNLLIDLHLMALVFVTMQIARGRVPAKAGILALAAMGLLATGYLARAKGDRGLSPQRAATLLAAMGPTQRGPFVCKPPMLHVYAREAPYILDPWMYRLLAGRDAKFGDKLLEDLRRRRFRAVVTMSLDDEDGEEGAEYQFGPGFAKALQENYQVTARLEGERYLVHRPRGEQPGVP